MRKGFALLHAAGDQKGVAYFGVVALSILSIVLGAFFGERIALFSDHSHSFMNPGEFYAMLCLVLACLFALFLLIKRNFRVPLNWPWLILFLVLGIGNAIGTFAFGTHFEGTMVYLKQTYPYEWTFTVTDRIQYVIAFFVSCIYFYLFFAVFPKVFPHTHWFRLFAWITVLVALASIVYSIINERDLYAILFDPEKRLPSRWVVSFTNNENTFATILLFGLIASCMLHNGQSRFYYWILIMGFGIAQFFVLSMTSIVCTLFLIPAYAIYRYVLNVRHKPGRATAMLLLLIGSTIAVIVLVFADPFGPDSFFGKLHSEAASYFGTRHSTFDTRVATWNIILDTISNPLAMICGIGDFQSRIYLSLLHVPSFKGIILYPAHSAFLQCLIDGGLIHLFVYLVVLGRFFYVAIKRINAHSRIVYPIFFAAVALLFHGTMETTTGMEMTTKGFAILTLIYLPLEIESFHARHPALQKYLNDCKSDVKKRKYAYEISPIRRAKMALYFLTPLFVIGVGVGAVTFHMGYLGIPGDWSYYLLWFVAILFAPLSYFAIGHANKTKAATFFFTLALLAILGGGIGLLWINAWFTRIACAILFLVCQLPILLKAKTCFTQFEDYFNQAYFPHLLVGGSLTALSLLALLIPEAEYSLFVPIIMVPTVLILCPALLAMPKKMKLAYPFAEKFHHFGARVLAKSVIRQEKLAAKEARRLNPHPVEVPPKRIYGYRL